MFNPSRTEVRQFFCDVWRKYSQHQPLTPLESLACDWVVLHPEYHALLAEPVSAQEYSSDGAATNPFLHLAMHLSIAEQLSIDQPFGIRAASQQLVQRLDGLHEAHHQIMECLGAALWNAERNHTPLDSAAYIACVRRRAQRI